jgi:hypothetical protein
MINFSKIRTEKLAKMGIVRNGFKAMPAMALQKIL